MTKIGRPALIDDITKLAQILNSIDTNPLFKVTAYMKAKLEDRGLIYTEQEESLGPGARRDAIKLTAAGKNLLEETKKAA